MRYHTSQRECPNLPVVSIIGSVKVTDQPGNAVKVSRTAVTEQAGPARTNQICATASHHNANINLHDDLSDIYCCKDIKSFKLSHPYYNAIFFN